METFNKNEIKFGRVHDDRDDRDYALAPMRIMGMTAKIPDSFDLRNEMKMPAVQSQTPLNSCVGQSVNGFLEIYMRRFQGVSFEGAALFAYYNARYLGGVNKVRQDNGATIRNGFKAVYQYGMCEQKYWPHSRSKVFTRPATSAYSNASNRQVLNYFRLLDVETINEQLAKGLPVVFGVDCYPGIMSSAAARTGFVPLPKRGERANGGHAILLVGYDLKKGQWAFRNSWGKNWGDEGYGYLEFENLDLGIASDFWTADKLEGDKPKPATRLQTVAMLRQSHAAMA